jgi:predicted ATPase/DNA-binding CsgD family transcriptional regulator
MAERVQASSGLHDFPAPVTSFVGRRAELRTVRSRISDSRLVTLTGVGGVGKTRLACQVAAELRRVYPDGVWFIDLSELREEELVPGAIADAFGVSAGRGDSALYENLARRHALVVLDNCEHVLDAASTVASRMLRAAPKLRILTTSRESLGVLGETIVDVAPLPFAADGSTEPDASGSEAMDLFAARAAAVAPEFVMNGPTRQAVAELCRLLDGIPLAIELAAFQVRTFSVVQILARHGSVFDMLTRGNRAGPRRHRTLQSTLEWSYGLCTDGERTLWERLSVFTGSFDIDAAEFVGTGEQDGLDVLEHLPRLIEKSIIVGQGGGATARYRLLESIKHFGAMKLAERVDPDLWRRRHRDHYLRVALMSAEHNNGPEQVEWNNRLEADLPDIRSALEYCFSVPTEYATGLRMACALWFFWNASGRLRDGRHWLGRALDLNTDPGPDRATALWAVGWYAMVQGDAGEADCRLRECLDLAERTNDERARASALQFQGTAAQIRGDVESARDHLTSAMSLPRRAAQDDVLAILGGAQLGFVYWVLGEGEEARARADDAIELGRRRGEWFATSWAFWVRALIAWSQGDFAGAAAALKEAIELKGTLRDWLGTAACVELLAWLAVEAGDHRRAALLLGIGRGLCGELASSPLFGDITLIETRKHYELATAEALRQPLFDEQLAAGEALDHDRAIAYVLEPAAGADEADRLHEPGILSHREIEVIGLIVDGMTNKEIAQHLVISRRTVEGHVQRALRKTGYRSRSQLAAWFAVRT